MTWEEEIVFHAIYYKNSWSKEVLNNVEFWLIYLICLLFDIDE